MSDNVLCPECHRPARVLETFSVERGGRPISYLRLECEGPPSFLVAVEDLEDSADRDGSGSRLAAP